MTVDEEFPFGNSYYVEKAIRWANKTGIKKRVEGIGFIKNIIALKGCTIKANGKQVTVDEDRVKHAKDILRGLKLMHSNNIPEE